MSATINPIVDNEIPVLLEMIRELARFEHLENDLEATEQSLRESLLGPEAAAGALLARDGGEPAGYATYFFTFSSFLGRRGLWLDDVYVRPQFRKRGLGRGLIEAVARVGAERNCGRLEWSALDWNANALEVYRKLGARVMDGWLLLRMNEAGIRRLAGAAR